MSSILTNTSAMTALQVLNSHNRTLAETQNRISTGFKVSSAKDSGSIYAIAQGMSGTDLDGTGLSYTNGHYIDQSTTLLYGDHSEFSVRPPSDVRFNAGMTSPVPVLPKGSDEYYIDLREVIYQPLVSKVSVLSNSDGALYDIYRRGMTVDALGLNNADAMVIPAQPSSFPRERGSEIKESRDALSILDSLILKA